MASISRFISLFFLLISVYCSAKPVDEKTAAIVASNFYSAKINTGHSKQNVSLKLVYKGASNSQNYFYAYNAGVKNGFVIISADDAVTPVLAYSNLGEFDPENISPATKEWLANYENEIAYIIENHIAASEKMLQQWQNLTVNSSISRSKKETTEVAPLVKTQWGQGEYFNALCPNNSATGCVATTMAQILKYWEYPAKGTGSHSYTPGNYSKLTADFGKTYYNWSAMPNIVNAPNTEVAQLMLHCGISVEMDYASLAEGGSNANVFSDAGPTAPSAEFALKNYFGYSESIKGIKKVSYNTDSWTQLIKNELDGKKPVIYTGFSPGGGHAFICDGYNEDDYFHFNWGWGGSSDGYFILSALNPGSSSTTGQGFNSSQMALVGIKPLVYDLKYNLKLFDNITADKYAISYNEGFTIHTNILNDGNMDFNGDYCAAVYSNGDFVDIVEILPGITLESHSYKLGGIDITTKGLFSLTPGTYTIRILYRQKGGEWKPLKSFGNIINDLTITVQNLRGNQLNLLFFSTKKFFHNYPDSTTLNLENTLNIPFKGSVNLALYNSDGSVAQDIETKHGIEICANCLNTKNIKDFVFRTSRVVIDPGNYIMAVKFKTDSTPWQFVAGANNIFSNNPVRVQVIDYVGKKDKYENNNSLAWPYSVTIPSYDIKFETAGANIHDSLDLDYYKLDFSEERNYFIKPRLVSKNTSGIFFKNDKYFSFSDDTRNWSPSYDQEFYPDSVFVKGGTSLYFRVTSKVDGTVGEYQLSVPGKITYLTSFTSVPESILQQCHIWPNPAQETIHVSLQNKTSAINSVKVFDVTGREISIKPAINSSDIIVPVYRLSNGLYFIIVETDKGIFQSKFVKKN